MRILGLSLLVGLILAAIACRQSKTKENPAVEAATVQDCAPVRIALMSDQTGSANWTRTPQLKPEDLEPLVQTLRKCGGELGFGLIRDQSNKGLLRLRVEQPPQPPATSNPLHRLQSGYEGRLRQWEAESDAAIEKFRKASAPLLDQAADARCTDIWGALIRADLFLAEKDASWGEAGSRWMVLITDGEHNCGGRPTNLVSEAEMLVVNGSASLGALAQFCPLRFESPAAAFRYIASRVESQKGNLAAVR